MTDVAQLERDSRAPSSSGDREIAQLAGRQYGVVSHAQLVALGLGRCAIQYRLAAGRLHRLHVGVYSVGHAVLTGYGRMMAAALACGPGALVSHVSAASLWGLLSDSRAVIDVTVTARRAHRGVVVHTVRRLHDDDRALIEGISVTTVARTLLDVAEVAPRRLERAIEEAERMGLFDLGEVSALIKRSRGRRGLRALHAALDAYRDRPFTRSELEREFSDLCRAADLPLPAFNAWVGAQEVDVLWHDQRLVVELDSHGFHRTRAAFERDRVRDGDLQLAGYRVLRVTHRRLRDEPKVIVSMVRSLLRPARGSSPSPPLRARHRPAPRSIP